MVSEQTRSTADDIKNYIKQHGIEYRTLFDLLDVAKVAFEKENDTKWALKVTSYIKECCTWAIQNSVEVLQMDDLYWKTLKAEAPYHFESFLFYMENNRRPEKRFYEPRKKTLGVVVQDLQDLEDGLLEFLGISLPPRVGKLISDDTPVLTSKGWKKHGDLRVGDYVYDYDGFPVMVTHVFPKNYANKRVWFTDGSFIDCHENHEWVIRDRHKGCERIAETKELVNTEIIDNKSGKRRYAYQIPLYQPLIGEMKDLPVKPYTLGAWLGDGRNGNPDICGAKEDYAIVDSIISDGYEVSWHTTHKETGVEYYGFKGLRADLQKIGMCHSRKRVEKHIPGEYMSAAIPQRLELLAGLLDTDGCLRKNEHRYDFTTAENELKEDFISLVSTFGWRCSVKEVEPHTSSSGIVGKKKYWVISFNPTYPIPCRLNRKQLFEFSKKRRIAIQKIEDIEPKRGNCISVQGGLYRVGRRCIPTHNSTLCIFFLAWVIGRHPESHNAMSGHSGILADRFYRDVFKLTENEEYTFKEIFPEINLANKSSEKNELYYSPTEAFATLTCRGIDGTWTGAVDISSDGYLYVDDMVRDRTESLSPIRLENRYQDYLNVLVDRKNDGSKELMVGTRWNVLDPLGRVETENKNNPKYRFRKIPALNEKDESNFQYDYGVGFSTEYYHKMCDRLDRNEWMAKYQQMPFIREGLILPLDELNYYNGVLPDGDCVTAAACDVAWGGGDSLSMPFGKSFGSTSDGLIYIPDWIFNKGDKYVTKPLVVAKTLQHKPNMEKFEANNGGDEYAESIDTMLREQGFKTNITWAKASNQIGKMAKIIQYAPDIKRRFVFLKPELQPPEYKDAMEELGMFTQLGRNEHDDAPDGLVQLLQLIDGCMTKTKIIDSPTG